MKQKYKLLLIYSALIMICCIISTAQPVTAQQKLKEQTPALRLHIFFKQANAKDTIFISADNIVLIMSGNPRYKHFAVNDGTGHFKFNLTDIPSFGYFTLAKNRNIKHPNIEQSPILMSNELFYETGDNLKINLEYTENESGIGGGAKLTIKGQGSLKYKLITKLADIDLKKEIGKRPQEVELETLRKFKNCISDLSFNIIKANLIYTRKQIESQQPELEEADRSKMLDYHEKLLENVDHPAISDLGLANSIIFQKYLLTNKSGLLIKATYEKYNQYTPDWIFRKILQLNIREKARETLLMRYFYLLRQKPDDINKYYNISKKYINENDYFQLLLKLQQQNSHTFLGDFTLESLQGQQTKLIQFKGKILLIDFWFTGCGGCSQYYQQVLSKVERHFLGNPNVVFLSVSIDRNKLTWKNSIESGLYTSTDATNLYTSGLGAAHPFIKENGIDAYPYVLLVNQSFSLKNKNNTKLFDSILLIDTIEKMIILKNTKSVDAP